MAKDDNKTLIVIGIIILVIFLGKSDFIGSIVTTCTNNEPTTIDEFRESILGLNGTFLNTRTYNLVNGNETIVFTEYSAISSIGTYTVIDTIDWECKDLLLIESQLDNTSRYLLLNQKQVLTTSGSVYWCNKQNNIAVKTTNIDELALYDEYYISCTSKEVDDEATAAAKDLCAATGGVWGEDECVCEDDFAWEGNRGCQERTGAQSPTSTTTTATSYTAPQTNTPTTTVPQTNTTSRYDTKAVISAIAVIIILFTLYYMFEKGPDKGFFQTKKSRRRKKK